MATTPLVESISGPLFCTQRFPLPTLLCIIKLSQNQLSEPHNLWLLLLTYKDKNNYQKHKKETVDNQALPRGDY
jgi:hypothetical protein